jgi:capsular exopolysaccharide synthesis family protein
LGAADKKVLIIDCDLRRPKIYSNLGLKEYSGMVNYLADSECSNPQKYIQTNVFPNVDIMTHGIIPPNPTEVLGTKKFMSLLEKLKDEYDNILLDGPPSCGMADAMVLAKSTDAILMIVECGKTKINDIMKTMEQFGTLQEKILGAILNKADIRKTNDYYYSYGYYYQSNTKPATNIPSIKEIDRELN